jgi:hypothetical protein
MAGKGSYNRHMARRRLPDIGETFTTPRSKRVFTCVGHQPHLNQRGDHIKIPIWTFRCITCAEPFTRTLPRPKVVRCKRCIVGLIPSTATVRRRQHNDGVSKRRLDRLADGQRATEQTPEKPPTRPRKPPPWQPEHQSAAVIAPTSGVFTD